VSTSRRRALALLFVVLALAFAGICVAAARADRWIIAAAAGALGLWLGSLAVGTMRR
jgi:succinate-acetate transporter protein